MLTRLDGLVRRRRGYLTRIGGVVRRRRRERGAPAEGRVEGGDGPVAEGAHRRGLPDERLRAVEEPWLRVEFGRDPGSGQAPRVDAALFVEQVEIADPDPRRRKPREVDAACGGGIGLGHRVSRFLPEIGLPRDVVAALGPAEAALAGMHRIEHGAVVEHRVQQHLEGDRVALVVRALGEAGGEAAAGTGSADGDAGGIDPQRGGLVLQPAQRGVAVIEVGREGMLGGQAVFDADHEDAQVGGQLPAHPVVELRRTGDVAAVVGPQQRAGRARALRRLVHAHVDGVPVRRGHLPVPQPHPLGGLDAGCRREQPAEHRDPARSGEFGGHVQQGIAQVRRRRLHEGAARCDPGDDGPGGGGRRGQDDSGAARGHAPVLPVSSRGLSVDARLTAAGRAIPPADPARMQPVSAGSAAPHRSPGRPRGAGTSTEIAETTTPLPSPRRAQPADQRILRRAARASRVAIVDMDLPVG